MNVRLKAVAEVHAGLSPPSDDVNTEGIGTPFLQGNAEFGRETPTPQYWTTSPRRLSQEGDLLISVRAPVGAINQSDQQYALGRGVAAVRPKSVNSRFLWWAAGTIAEQLKAASRGSTYEAVVGSDVENTRLDLPDAKTQALIADFLDRESHRIDALVEAKGRMINLLKEKRTSVIDALTSFGVPIQIKRVARVSYGLGQPPPTSESGVPIVRATNISRGKIDRGSLIYARPEDLPLDRVPLLRAGEILVVRSGALTGDSAIVTEDFAGASPGYDLRLTVHSAHPDYVAWSLLGSSALDQIDLVRTRAAQPHINADDLGSLRLRIPDWARQEALAREIENETHRIGSAIALLRSQLDLLAEYRQALITQAVTGQLDEATLKGDKRVDEAVGVIPE